MSADDDPCIENDRRQDRALRRGELHDGVPSQLRIECKENRRDDSKIFRHVVCDRERGESAPRVMSSCLPISTTSISLVGSASRSTMLPASRAACVPACMATPTSACASAGASLVPSPTSRSIGRVPAPYGYSATVFPGVAWAMKSSTPASEAIEAAVTGLSPVIITVLMPMRRSAAKRSFTSGFTTSFK